MFQFRRFPTYTYLIQCTLHGYCPCGLPHSEIHGSTDICSSPWLIAACRVLHRLLMPRHSPCALSSLTWRRAKSAPLRFQRQPPATAENSAPLLCPTPFDENRFSSNHERRRTENKVWLHLTLVREILVLLRIMQAHKDS